MAKAYLMLRCAQCATYFRSTATMEYHVEGHRRRSGAEVAVAPHVRFVTLPEGMEYVGGLDIKDVYQLEDIDVWDVPEYEASAGDRSKLHARINSVKPDTPPMLEEVNGMQFGLTMLPNSPDPNFSLRARPLSAAESLREE